MVGAGGQTFYTVFGGNGKYYVFLLFGKTTVSQTYDLYVGTDFDPDNLRHVQVNAKQITEKPPSSAFTDNGPFNCSDGSKECSLTSQAAT